MNDESLRRYAILLTGTATVIFAVVLISMFFWFTNTVYAVDVNDSVNASAPAKWIEKCFSYDIDNEYWSYPPIVGLPVGFGQGDRLLWTHVTDGCGCVSFGSGLPDGSYWMNWTWGGEHYIEHVDINCSRLVWSYTNVLPAKDA